MCYVTSLAVVMLNLAPELEQQLRAELSYEPAQVGTFFIVELGALGAASIPFNWASRRMGTVWIARVALLLWARCRFRPCLRFPGCSHAAASAGSAPAC